MNRRVVWGLLPYALPGNFVARTKLLLKIYYLDIYAKFGGQVQVLFGSILVSIEQIRAGKLRALAVTTATRSDALPDIPTVGEFLPGYEASGWWGVGAPKNTPAEIVEKLNKEINAVLAEPKMKLRLAELDSVPTPMSPADFRRLIADETERWAKVIRAANIKAE